MVKKPNKALKIEAALHLAGRYVASYTRYKGQIKYA